MTPATPDEALLATHAAYLANDKNQSATAKALGVSRETVQRHVRQAAERGLLGYAPVLEGFAIKSIASKTADGAWVKQVKEAGEEYATPPGMIIKKRSVLSGADNRVLLTWNKEDTAAQATIDIMKSALDAFKEEIPRVAALSAPSHVRDDLLNQFVVTDNHFGMLSWREETGADYDLRIAEQLLLDWFSAAIAQAPDAHTAILAQLGDLMHHDALESVTPAHRHVLDADSRLQKVIRVVIRTIRRIIDMLLQSHQHVHVVMASGNHDPASSAWLREMLATMYEDEPRISVDNSPSLYYAYEWGRTGLYYHHMHKRGVKDIDRTFAGMFREMFGRCRYNYGHGGHRHSDEVIETPLMIVERHQTLAAPDAHSAGGGWLSGRSAKRVTYSRQFGEVGRDVLRPEMVMGASRFTAANDNEPKEMAA
ncbi:helix-turn-helix domain-containing protein [Mesorhizobium sp. BR1-1-7]|uniref:helix-turn-helix domain-containing protein n=1 Tax=Mesorhizobium sp. BR1-1-7 TaxID=2876647 RepID=UPI001CCA69EE|nr:helix-turn-helix domain-containing protein [Mesorhizobium sp. BR1-1-7]MBZ9921806.1 helix-turn-helix domain-containing protein [Mesorhizobium sp. BR1-1-7]